MSNILHDKRRFYRVVYALIIAILSYFFVKSFTASLFIQNQDRVNFVIYDTAPVLYSLSTVDSINYAVLFDHDTKVQVPGGYGEYRFGALGKLSNLEKRSDIMKKAYASATSTTVDYYFFPKSDKVHYGAGDDTILAPSFYKIFLYRSNAGILDRLYIFFSFIGKSTGDLTRVEYTNPERFQTQYQGYFYQKSYREENKTVQIKYTESYRTADMLSNILRGSGVNVVDIAHEPKAKGGCVVVESSDEISETSRVLGNYFGCSRKLGQTGAFDIIITLGSVEKEWEVR